MPQVYDITKIDSNDFNRINVKIETTFEDMDKSIHSVVKDWMDNDQEQVFVKDLELPSIRGMANIHCRAMYLCTAEIYIKPGAHPTNSKPLHGDIWYTKCSEHENGSIVMTHPNDDKVMFVMVFNQSYLPLPYREMKLNGYFDLLLKCPA